MGAFQRRCKETDSWVRGGGLARDVSDQCGWQCYSLPSVSQAVVRQSCVERTSTRQYESLCYRHGRIQTQRWTASHDAWWGDVNLSRATREERHTLQLFALQGCICLSSGCLLSLKLKGQSSFLHSVGSPNSEIRASSSSACFLPLYFIIKLSICENFPLKSTLTPHKDKHLCLWVTWQMAKMPYQFLFGYVTQTTEECYESSGLSSLSLLWGELTKARIILSLALSLSVSAVTQEMRAARKSLWQLCVSKRPNVRSLCHFIGCYFTLSIQWSLNACSITLQQCSYHNPIDDE